jgi:molybdate transport system substrate-binding protein
MSQPIKVMQSILFKEAYLELAPRFERESGLKLENLWVSSVDVSKRMKAGEVVDMVILARNTIDELTSLGRLAADSRTDIARSAVGVAVRAGAPHPDISSWDALKQAIMAAKCIAYSTGPSGVYVADLFQRKGIAEAIKSKVKVVTGTPAGELVARGEADIAFQQVCELLPVKGIELVGPLSRDVEKITVFSAAVHAQAPEAAGARALIKYIASPASAPVIKKTGLEPISS